MSKRPLARARARARRALAAGPYHPIGVSPDAQALIDTLVARDRLYSRLVKDIGRGRAHWYRRAA